MKKHDLVAAFKQLSSDLGREPTEAQFKKQTKYGTDALQAIFGIVEPFEKLKAAAGVPVKDEKPEPKILLWDIEATNLNANYGFVVCIGYMWLHEGKVRLISIRDFPQFKKEPWNDKYVCEAFAKVMAEADLQVYHYGDRYDYPMIQSKMLEHEMPPLPQVPAIDTWRVAKYRLKLSSNRLETLQNFIPSVAASKTPISHTHWRQAMSGHGPAIKYIEEHCIADVEVLAQVYKAVVPFIKSHPNMAKINNPKREGCPNCGGTKVQRRGYSVTPRGRFARCQCQECCAWFQMPESKL